MMNKINTKDCNFYFYEDLKFVYNKLGNMYHGHAEYKTEKGEYHWNYDRNLIEGESFFLIYKDEDNRNW
jgi:hypothetical protein